MSTGPTEQELLEGLMWLAAEVRAAGHTEWWALDKALDLIERATGKTLYQANESSTPKTLMLLDSTNALRELYSYAEWLSDTGPVGAGWKSEGFKAALQRAKEIVDP